VPGEHRPDRELEQRHPARHEVADGGLAVLQPQVTGVEAVGLHGDERLRDELLLEAERAQRGLLAGRVAVEREDHFAGGPVGVHDQPPQDLHVILAEGRAAGRHRRRHS
jgi:hypothetical protein